MFAFAVATVAIVVEFVLIDTGKRTKLNEPFEGMMNAAAIDTDCPAIALDELIAAGYCHELMVAGAPGPWIVMVAALPAPPVD